MSGILAKKCQEHLWKIKSEHPVLVQQREHMYFVMKDKSVSLQRLHFILSVGLDM